MVVQYLQISLLPNSTGELISQVVQRPPFCTSNQEQCWMLLSNSDYIGYCSVLNVHWCMALVALVYLHKICTALVQGHCLDLQGWGGGGGGGGGGHAFIGMVYCPPMYFPTIVCSQQVNHMHRECLVHAGSELMLAALLYSSPGSRLSLQNWAIFEEGLGTQLA